MKNTNYLLSGLLLLALVSQFCTPLYAQTGKRNIAVLDLDAMGISKAEAQFLSDRLRTELFETGAFQVVEREKMQEILEEQGFQKTGCTSVECAIEIGQLLNVSEMVAGNIGQIEEVYSISIRIIKVETGAITKTATRDYEGKLSEVLTDVIPGLAAELAREEAQVVPGTKEGISKTKEEDDKFSRFAIFVKGGVAFLQYTQDVNQFIDEFNETYPEFSFDQLSNHSNFGFEGHYYFSKRAFMKIGLTRISINSPLNYDVQAFEDTVQGNFFDDINFERDYSFVNVYAGINYNIWFAPQKYAFYIGADIGSMVYEARIKEDYIKEGETYKFDNSYSYSAFTFKFATGFKLYLGRSFSLAAELVLQSVAEYNTSDEGGNFEYFPDDYWDVIFPDNINGSGVQLNLLAGFHL
jgi:hypothetical protein